MYDYFVAPKHPSLITQYLKQFDVMLDVKQFFNACFGVPHILNCIVFSRLGMFIFCILLKLLIIIINIIKLSDT